MRQYNAWQAIPMSFYSKKLYKDVAVNWGGFAFLYLLLILALSMIFWTYELQHAFNQVYVKITDKFVAQIPVLTIKNGKISTPEKRPYLIKDVNDKNVIAVVDTTGKYKTLKDTKTDLLITDNEIITAPKPNEIRIDKIPANMNFVFEPTVIDQYVKSVLAYAWVLLFPLMVIFAFIYRLIQALIYAIIGRIFGAISSSGVTYPQVLQIALVAITPVIVLITVIDAFSIHIAHSALWAFIIAMAYLFYGVLANKAK